jgi:acetylornithine deacetylase
VFIRLVEDGNSTRRLVEQAVAGKAEAKEVLAIPAVRLGSLPGFETTVVSYTTDIPAFGGAWGQPFLVGPGTIHVAHTAEERIPKKQLTEAVPMFQRIVRQLLSTNS